MMWPEDRREKARQILSYIFSDFDPDLETRSPYSLLRELVEMASVSTTTSEMEQAVRAVRPTEEDPLEALEHAYRSAESLGPEFDVPREFKFFVPLQMVLGRKLPTPTQIHLRQTRFFLRPKGSVERELGPDVNIDETLLLPMEEWGEQRVPPTILTCTGRGQSMREAWNHQVAADFDLLRGLLEFVMSDYSWKRLVDDDPRAAVPHPPRVVWLTSDRRLAATEFLVHAHRPVRRIRLTTERFRQLQKLSRLLTETAAVADSVGETVGDALRLYAMGMHTAFPHHAFLSLYQGAEALVFGRELSGSPKKIGDRVNWVLREADKRPLDYSRTLKSLGDRRNALVHRGRRDRIGVDDVNVLKEIVEKMLHWYLEQAQAGVTSSRLRSRLPHSP